MKKINIKSFWIILTGIISTLIYRVVELVLSRNREFPKLKERMSAERLERLSKLLFGLNFFAAVILALICAYFVYRLIKNLKTEAGQGYITFLFVVSIIFAVFNLLSLLLGNFLALIDVAINGVIITGCVMQKNYEPPKTIAE